MSVGGFIVDGGRFDYAKSGRFDGFTKPDESYHGLVYSKDCGNAAFITKARVQLMRDMGTQISPFNAWLTNLGMETLSVRMERFTRRGERAVYIGYYIVGILEPDAQTKKRSSTSAARAAALYRSSSRAAKSASSSAYRRSV